MVNDATYDMCDGLLSSALEGGFASLDDGNRFWLDTSRSHRRGWLTEHLLAHGGLPGRMRTWSNVLAPRDGAMVGEAEVDVPVLRERGVLVFGSRSCSGCVFGLEGQRMWTQSLNRATEADTIAALLSMLCNHWPAVSLTIPWPICESRCTPSAVYYFNVNSSAHHGKEP